MRALVLSRRWIGWHLLTLAAVGTCGWLAVWQWQRAGSSMGSVLNVGYGLQWPLFAAFFAVMWWRMLRMEAAALAADVGPADVAAGPEEGTGTGPSSGSAVAPPPAPPPDAGSPFGRAPAAARPAPGHDDEDDPELAAYNRMLAQLAARHPDD